MDNTLKQELLKKRELLMVQIELIDGLLNNYNANPTSIDSDVKSSDEDKYSDYDKSFTNRNKVAYVIKKADRFLHSKEIQDKISELEGKEFDMQKVSSTLSLLKRDGIIVKIQVTNRNRDSFWGVSRWLDESGNVFKEHVYDESLLSKSQKELFDI